MNCYLHPQAEGVVACGKCGVAMCKECEEKAFFRLDGGTGQALCNCCSLVEAQSVVDFEASWLKKRIIKLIFCTIFIVSGLIGFFTFSSSGDKASGILCTVIFWAISGAVANIGNKTDNDSVKSQVKNAAYEYEHPFMNMIIRIIINALFGPILLIAHFIGYIRTKSQYAEDFQILETIKAAVNQ